MLIFHADLACMDGDGMKRKARITLSTKLLDKYDNTLAQVRIHFWTKELDNGGHTKECNNGKAHV